MRDYSKISGKFWTGATGKLLRGEPEAQLVALYLMTSPHSNMIGVFTLPVAYIAYETGLPFEGASKGLERCIEVAFCTYDYVSESVFVHEMAAHQIGEGLKAGDKRMVGVRKQFDQLAAGVVKSAFHARYNAEYGLANLAAKSQLIEGPSIPLRSQEQEQEQEKEQDGASSLRSDSSTAAPPDLLGNPAESTSTFPADPAKHKVDQLAQVTDSAIAAFNASTLVKRNGGNLAAVSATVGREKRQSQIRRCLRTVRAICKENYGSSIVTADFWPDYWAELANDDFHAGRQPGGRGHENWKPDFEFLTREDVMLKVYDRAAAEDAA